MATPYPQVTLASMKLKIALSPIYQNRNRNHREYSRITLAKPRHQNPPLQPWSKGGGTNIPNLFLLPNSHSTPRSFLEKDIFCGLMDYFLVVMHWLTDWLLCCDVMWTVCFFVVFCEEKRGKELLIAFFFGGEWTFSERWGGGGGAGDQDEWVCFFFTAWFF